MHRNTLTVLLVALAFIAGASLPAQELSKQQFIADFNQGYDLNDEKLMDRAVKRGARVAIEYYEELWWEVRNQVKGAELKCDALMASWQRCFDNTTTLEKQQRWVDGCSTELYKQLQSIRSDSARLWNDYLTIVSKNLIKEDYRNMFLAFMKLARSAETIGHYKEASELWGLASVVGNKTPGKTIEEREEVVFVIEQQLAAMENWGFTFNEHYIRNKEFVKAELLAIEEAKKAAGERADAGYSADSKGIDALVMPNVPAAKHELEFKVLKDWQKDLDYGPKNGPVPPFWWLVSVGEEGTSRKFDWFRRRDLYLHRTGSTKFAVGFDAADAKDAFEIDASSRPKASQFYLAPDKQAPYAMFFWLGGEQEMTGMASCNYAPVKERASVYYRSAASWRTQVDKDTLVFYDDNANGTPGDADPFEGGFKSHVVGDPTGGGVAVPLLDSMRVGRGERVPFSAFVELSAGWHHLEIEGSEKASLRPLNPEYFKTGKVKLAWDGPKTSAPDQLVIRGRGDYSTAMFDLAAGKEVEVPAGQYDVIFGRIVNGRGARVQLANLYPGAETKPFTVEEGKTFALEMGAPFQLQFTREGDKNASIDALSIHVREKAGCKITEFHGCSLAGDVMAAKDDSGKGKKEVGEFVPFTNANLVATASQKYNNLGFMVACFPMPKGYQKDALVLSFETPADGMKVGLYVKKHPLFGKELEIVWQ